MGIGACTAVPQEIAEAVQKENNVSQVASSARRRDLAAASVDLVKEAEVAIGEIGPSSSTLRGRTFSQREEHESCVDPISESSQRPKQRELHSSFLSVGLQKQRQKVADIEIERCILECNLSFNVVHTDAWKRMVKAIAQVGPCENWHGVDYNRLRGPMLVEEKERIEVLLSSIKLGWQVYGCSILSDGWSDMRRRHIINIMVSSCLGTYFLRAIDCSKAGTRITGEFIFEHIKLAIQEVGVENVVQVVTDNASNCKRMGELLEREFPTIVWTPCTAHCLDLLFEDIGKLSWLEPIVRDDKRITTFIRKNHQALSIFRSYTQKELVRLSSTRFAYIYHVLSRLYDCVEPLRMTAIELRWMTMTQGQTEAARYVQRKILDMDFWMEIQNIIPILKFIHVALRVVNMEGSTIGLVYHLYQQMRHAISSSSKNDVLRLVDSRWEYLSRPIHGFAALLHPYFKRPNLWSNGTLHQMKDLYMERILFPDDQIAFDADFSAFMGNIGIAYARTTSVRREVTSRPLEWWNHYGYGHPHMSRHALRDSSSSPCERNWSTFSLVHTKLYNCLSVAQLERVVFSKANLRLLQNLRDLKGPRQMTSIVCYIWSWRPLIDELRDLAHTRYLDRRRQARSDAPSTSTVAPRGGRRKLRTRRRGDLVPPEEDIHDDLQDDPLTDIEFDVPLLDYDDEGNPIIMDAVPSSESSSSDLFTMDDA
ncbi:hypothetical protein KP509_21G068500 [Ceratopteris richardii]|uniref:DUF659 domain-containing protein n=1 Tax=Ceratopteris richardii TaxID=49495 RepID=A0A8T2SDX5_CERRI|nr:hypothetical protein KP509_21G068500 [Ceratopteris richardii]